MISAVLIFLANALIILFYFIKLRKMISKKKTNKRKTKYQTPVLVFFYLYDGPWSCSS